MKNSFVIFACFLISISGCNYPEEVTSVISPDEKIKLQLIDLQSDIDRKDVYHVPAYKVSYQGHDVINPSRLGFTTNDENLNFSGNLELIRTETMNISDEYTLSSGKQVNIHSECNELRLFFINEEGSELRIDFRAYNEGIAFRYVLQNELDEEIIITKELTSFSVPNGNAWILPYDKVTNWSPAYETWFTNGIPVGQQAPSDEGWSFPALFETGEQWLLVSESGVYEDYCASHLQPDAGDGVYRIRFPEEGEHFGDGWVEPRSVVPWRMPWRFIAIGDLASIVENNMVYHLAEPNAITDTSWIHPGISSWSWWSSTSGRSLSRLKEFVDLAAEMNWRYSLVDAGWENMEGGNLQDLIDYATTKNVDLLLWYNSGGRKTEAEMDSTFILEDKTLRRKEFQRISEMGIKGIKADFFNSDKQFIIRQYINILKDAAEFNLVVNFHGCTLPRGWRRTYPNLLTMEAVKGAEAYRFSSDYPENAIWHNTILPFTRNVVGPMDYTPVTFSDNTNPRLTSNAHELALSIIYESGIVHMADNAETYLTLPDEVKNILRHIHAAWDKTLLLDGYPGKYAVIARKKGDTWFVGGINATQDYAWKTNLSFWDGPVKISLVTDAANKASLKYEHFEEISELPDSIHLSEGSGFLMMLKK